MNTPEHPREHPCSKWREHPLNTPPANTGRMKPKARKPNKIKGFACLNTLHTFSVNFTAWLALVVILIIVISANAKKKKIVYRFEDSDRGAKQ